MKILSTFCSIVLLGTIYSGLSMAMDGAGAEGELQRPLTRKQLTIKGYYKSSDIREALSNTLACDALDIRIEGNIISRSGTPEGAATDEVALLTHFLTQLEGKSPTVYSHGVHYTEEAVAEIAPTRDSAYPSPHQIKIVNGITSDFDVTAIEKQSGPMARHALSILSLCPNVNDLSLKLLTMDRRGIEALQSTSRLSLLRVLEIRHAQMGDEEVAMLLAGPLPKLEFLDLTHNNITGLSFSGASLPALETLDLWNNKVGNEGLRAITESQSPSLRTLSLVKNTINEEGLRTARWGDRNLEILLLDCNPIHDGGARVLANPQYLPTLKVLGLAYSESGVEGLEALKARLSIKMIDVAGAKISPKEQRQVISPNLFVGKGISHHHANGRVFTLGEIAAKYYLEF